MKKNLSRKLALNKETIRKLNDAELRQAVGGGRLTREPQCICTGPTSLTTDRTTAKC